MKTSRAEFDIKKFSLSRKREEVHSRTAGPILHYVYTPPRSSLEMANKDSDNFNLVLQGGNREEVGACPGSSPRDAACGEPWDMVCGVEILGQSCSKVPTVPKESGGCWNVMVFPANISPWKVPSSPNCSIKYC